MVGPSKILTVSYGTFSCTLEGFDDPFSTMRGIAEYFRDLAADDRYFGAEPPTPDAEMLHRIAQREINRRVEARVENNGIVLRQMEDRAEPAVKVQKRPAAAAPAAAPASAQAPEVETYDFTEAMPARGESVAAKLARIRAAVARREDDAGQTYRDESHVVDNIPQTALAAAFEDEAEEPAETAAAEQAGAANDMPEEQAVEALEDDVAQDEPAAEVDEAEAEQEPLVAVEEQEPTLKAEEPEAEEEAETAVVEETEIEVELEVETVSFAEEEAEAEPFEDEEFEVEVEAIAKAFDEDDEEEALTETSYEDVADSDLEDEAEEEDAALVAEEIREDMARTAAMARVMDQMPDEEEDEDDSFAEPESSEEPDAPAIARVIKMRRADFEDDAEEEFEAESLESAEAEEEVDEEVEAETEAEETLASDEDADADLSDEDEADLMATLAQVRRESEAESRADKEGRAVLERDDLDNNGNGVQRILEVTNTELEETEGTRRRSAIQHLKAAVLATRADKKLSKEKAAENDAKQMDQYREDLARVVRPRRPADGMKPTERRQAPLVLVSEQRVDVAEAPAADKTAEAIRPRRISAAQVTEADDQTADDRATDAGSAENIFADANSFAEFAENMGATELPDLLEAAAAYASYVEGRPHFSRPQIMRAVATFDSDDAFNREDTLRSFGQLLRHGKIRKLSRGQFTVAQSTRFNPSVRAAGE